MLTFLIGWMTLAHAACEDKTDAAKEVLAERLKALVQEARGEGRDGALAAVRSLDDGDLCSRADRYHAAAVLVRGDGPDLERAYQLARQAYDQGLTAAGGIAATAFDTGAVRSGEPQRYGRARGRRPEGGDCLQPIDPDATDAQRAELGQPPLEQVLSEVIERSGQTVEPTLAAMAEAGLICGVAAAGTPSGFRTAAEVAESQRAAEAERAATADAPTQRASGASSLRDMGDGLTFGEQYGFMGYWSGNAWTMRPGDVAVRPLMRSGVGVAPFLDVKSSLLGWLGGPNGHVELAPIQGTGGAVSLEVGGSATWAGTYVGYGELKGSAALSDAVFLTVGFYGRHQVLEGTVTTGPTATGPTDTTTTGTMATNGPTETDFRLTRTQLKPKLAVEARISDHTSFVASWRMGLLYLIEQEALTTSVGGYLVYGRGLLGFSGGLNVNYGELPGDVQDAVPDQVGIPTSVVLPTPHLQLWFRL